jgi:tRNA pseudouridine-54 N-methylase
LRRHLVYFTDRESILSPETCSVTTSSFFLSHDIRRDVRLYVASEEFSVLLDGSSIRLLRPDAQSTRGLLKKVLQVRDGGGRRTFPKGFTVINGGVERLLKHLPNAVLCYPTQKGHSVGETKFGNRDPTLIVGGDRAKALEVAKACKALPIRLSRWPLPPNHEIVLFNILLDRMGMIDGYSPDR